MKTASALTVATFLASAQTLSVSALDGGTLQISPKNGWDAFEVITNGEDVPGDGFAYALPGTFDGLGAQLDGSILRIQLNHETSDASITQVLLDQANFKTAIANVITNGGGNTGGVNFVTSASQAYTRWSANGGANWTATANTSNTSFARFCSGQSYLPNTFGSGRGFVDNIYVTGEEIGGGRLFALDIDNDDFYQISGVTGTGGTGLGGMPFDAYENAALVDTGETNHVAMVLAPDGGSETLMLYVGEKGKDASGNASSDFLARNGLAYGSHYYFNASIPGSVNDTTTGGIFDTTLADAFTSGKLEDVDTNPNTPDEFVLADQTDGVYTFDLDLDFSGGAFNAGASSFSVTKIGDDGASGIDSFNNPDNLDWIATTTLDGTTYSDGLIFVNEDSDDGEVWIMNPDGTGKVSIATTISSVESTGILDISELVGYLPGSILLTNNQGSSSSMSVLVNPDATLVPEPGSMVMLGFGGMLLLNRRRN